MAVEKGLTTQRSSVGRWWVLILFVLLPTVAGCSVGLRETYPFPDYQLRTGLYPTIQRVHHPDSLVNLDQSYSQIEHIWSAGFTDVQGGRYFETGHHRTYATLWSRELAMAWTADYVRRVGMTTQEAAGAFVDEQEDLQDHFVTFVVHFYAGRRFEEGFSVSIRHHPLQFILRDQDGGEYEPALVEVEEAHVVYAPDGRADAIYQPNIVRFPRRSNGDDILYDVRNLTLEIHYPFRPRVSLRFNWRFPDSDGSIESG